MSEKKTGTPYARATAGDSARGEIVILLQKFGCNSVGFMDEFDKHTVLLVFEYRGRRVRMRASASGWAEMFLRDNPYQPEGHYRRRCTEQEWEERAIKQGMIAVSSVLRDWVKGQMTAVECGLMPFDDVFLPYFETGTGHTVAEAIKERGWLPELPAPEVADA